MSRFRLRLGGALLATMLLSAAPTSAAVATTTPAAKAVKRVVMQDNVFKPKAITISKGDKVKWVNNGDVPHTTTGSGWNGVVQPDQSYVRKFKKAGTFSYRCTFHSGMKGKVIVR